MPVTLNVNGTNYNYPTTGDQSAWGQPATLWAAAVTANLVPRAGGAFTLTGQVDFGATAGLKALNLTSETALPGLTGFIRMAATDQLVWRDIDNSVDLYLTVDVSNNLVYNGSVILTSTSTFVAPSATYSTYLTINTTGTNATFYPSFFSGESGNLGAETSSNLTFNPSTGNLSATTFTGALVGNASTATSATNASGAAIAASSAITLTSTSSTFYPTFVSATSGNSAIEVSSGLTFNPNTNNLSATTFTGALAGNASTATFATSAAAATSATSATTAANLSGTPTLPNGTSATTQATSDSSTNIATDAFVQNVGLMLIPIGAWIQYGGTSAPTNFLQLPTSQILISTSTYPSIFAVVGYQWGGSGANYALPYVTAGSPFITIIRYQ